MNFTKMNFSSFDCLLRCHLLSSADLSWMFRPNTVLESGADGLDYIDLSLQQHIPLQLANMSAFSNNHANTDETQDKVVHRIFFTAMVKERVSKTREKEAGERPHAVSAGRMDWMDLLLYSGCKGANLAHFELDTCLRNYDVKHRHGQLAPFPPD